MRNKGTGHAQHQGKNHQPKKERAHKESLPSHVAAKKSADGGTALLRRLSESTQLPALIAQLEPRALHKLVAHVGLSDAIEIMELASPQQLVAALDLAVWKQAAPKAAETFDADVFVQWIEVWLEIGEGFTAARLLELGEDYLATALASLIEVQSIHVRGFEGGFGWKLQRRFEADADLDVTNPGGFDGRTADELAHDARWGDDNLGERLREDPHRRRDEADDFDRDANIWASARPAESSATEQEFFGEYVVGGLISDEWHIVLAALNTLWTADPDKLLVILARLATDPSMLAVGDHRSLLRDDVARERELQQAAQGFVTPLGASAFLAGIASSALEALAAANSYDQETVQYFARVKAAANAATRKDDVDGSPDPARMGAQGDAAADNPDTSSSALTELHQILVDAGIETSSSAAVAALPAPSRHAGIDVRAAISALADSDPQAAAQRLTELAYLANVLAVAVRQEGTAINDVAAAEIVLVTVGLGLEYLQEDYSISTQAALCAEPGAVRAFSVGWHLLGTLRAQIVAACAAAVAQPEVVQRMARQVWLRDELGVALTDLDRYVREGAFEGAREALTLLSLVLNADACRRLRPVLDQVPRFSTSTRDDEAQWIRSMNHWRQVVECIRHLA